MVGVSACLLLAAGYFSAPARALRALPDTVYVRADERARLRLPEGGALLQRTDERAVEASASGDETLAQAGGGVGVGESETAGSRVTYRLFGLLPLRSVQVQPRREVLLTPGGEAVGITIRTQGVLIVGLGAVDAAEGALSPGSAAGLAAGDVILAADGVPVNDAEGLMAACQRSGGNLRLTIDRNGEAVQADVPLVRDKNDGAARIGVWVRDSTAGVGTLSFCDVETGWFAALGHAVSDVDTQSLLSVRDGRILESEIVSVRKGETGNPGELIGAFSVSGKPLGAILGNSEFGIFGSMDAPPDAEKTAVPMGYGYEAHTGEAEILATVAGKEVAAYRCEILRVNAQSSAAVKGMIVEITDPALLAKTGGIVQGMSGCPVLQDGRLVGVVTHVFVNDPTRGYGVYAEWMWNELRATAG